MDYFLLGKGSDYDRLGKLLVDIIPSVLYGDNAAALEVRDNGDRLAAVAAQGEEERVQLFIVGLYLLDDIFFSFLGVSQIHKMTSQNPYGE